jgi:hypothetical protein
MKLVQLAKLPKKQKANKYICFLKYKPPVFVAGGFFMRFFIITTTPSAVENLPNNRNRLTAVEKFINVKSPNIKTCFKFYPYTKFYFIIICSNHCKLNRACGYLVFHKSHRSKERQKNIFSLVGSHPPTTS